MKQFFLFALALLFAGHLFSQRSPTLSDSARVSLMTVAPGEFLYSTFGHSALRVYDMQNRLDRCYNYGTFDFDQPGFILKFCRGKLLYFLDIEPYRGFEYSNLQDKRGMQEQVLNLNKEQKQRLFDLLQENAKEENRFYKYDFFYDNCATRIRDIVKEAFYQDLVYDSTHLALGTTMRQLLHPYLADKPWTSFGIDLVLGYASDKRARPEDFMFLPDHMHDIFATTRIKDATPLVKSERRIPDWPFPAVQSKAVFFGNPLLVMSLVAVIGLLCMANPRTERIFDTIFWFVLGIAGAIIAFLWFATDHTATKTNLNILWALPTHLFFFWRNRRTEMMDNYFTGVGILASLVLLFWAFIPQEMPVAAIPIAGLVVVKGLWRRYWKKEPKEDA
ncbi:MAG: DUF4105 domain-containing protein [Saprospiraceae bacterium]|nr:DUF4105 domain-containing protein [Saprospiraceae bacterium]